MADWIKCDLNAQNIKVKTEKAVLITMPHSSKFDGFQFWHPIKLVRRVGIGYFYTFSFTNEFEFKLKKMGQGRYNRSEVIDEKTISADEMIEAFKG